MTHQAHRPEQVRYRQRARWTRTAVLIASTCLAFLVGCGGSPERADTVPAPSPDKTGATSSPTATATPANRDEKTDAGGTLNAEQLRAALLTLDDMPSGWTQGKPQEDNEDPKITPARCEAVFNGATDRGSVAKARASFSAGDLGPNLDQDVLSWHSDMAPVLEGVRDALTACPKFTSTSADGEKVTFEAAPLSFPNLGDRTLAVRLKSNIDGLDATVDVVMIASGRNAINLFATSVFTPMKGEDLEELARTAVERLHDAV